jgi:hypothetical protein
VNAKVIPIGQRVLAARIGRLLSPLQSMGMPVPDIATGEISFQFRRCQRGRRVGWQIRLVVDGVLILLPECGWAGTDRVPFPRSKRRAVQWALAFAKRHGLQPREAIDRI